MSRKIIIIGGLSAGPAAAAKARREDEHAEILLFEKTGNISYATCGIPYALSGKIKKRSNLLVVEAGLLRSRFQIDVRLNEEVLDIDPQGHTITTSKGNYKYDKLIYAAGANTVIPKIENLEQADNWSPCRTLANFDRLMKDDALAQAQNITVLGAGLIGVEVVENLKITGKNVTLIEGSPQILPMWEGKFSHFAQNTLEENGVSVITNRFATKFILEADRIQAIETDQGEIIHTDFVVISVGIRPNTRMLTEKGAEAIGNGALLVNEYMQTTLPDIYAAGDCAAIKNILTGEHDYLPLGTHSNKGGRTAGVNAAGGQQKFRGGYKTAIIKIFDKTLARTGMNPGYLQHQGIPYQTNLIVAGATPGYYPGQQDLIIETYFDPEEGTILGCEIFGAHGADKRIDVMSTAIYAKLKIEDLPNLDLAYAPPFSPAKDPVIVSGYVSGNSLNDSYREMSVEELHKLISNGSKKMINLIDVRSPLEIENSGKISDAISIELHKLRKELNTLNSQKATVVYCAKGMRGYIAYRILAQNGFENLYNLSGGYTVYNQLYN